MSKFPRNSRVEQCKWAGLSTQRKMPVELNRQYQCWENHKFLTKLSECSGAKLGHSYSDRRTDREDTQCALCSSLFRCLWQLCSTSPNHIVPQRQDVTGVGVRSWVVENPSVLERDNVLICKIYLWRHGTDFLVKTWELLPESSSSYTQKPFHFWGVPETSLYYKGYWSEISIKFSFSFYDWSCSVDLS